MNLKPSIPAPRPLAELEKNSAMDLPLVKIVFRSVAVLLGATQLILARNSFGPDSRSYSEIARAYLRHDWPMAINAYWSPFYSWLIALALKIGNPSLRQEFPLLHLLNFFIFVVALVAFEFFWSGLLNAESLRRLQSAHSRPEGLPPASFWILGYVLFTWLTVGSILAVIGPDLCVTVIVFFLAGLLIRIKGAIAIEELGRLPVEKKLYIWLGIALGVGYLTKAVMFPMAFVLLAVTLCLRLNYRNFFNVLLALVIFVSIAAPQIILISGAKARFTFGDSGKLNFAWNNYGLPNCNWQGQSDSGTPLHPTRMVDSDLQMFEFNGPIAANYPPWYDPSYWNDGLSPRFSGRLVFRNFVRNATIIALDFARPRVWFAGVIVLLLICDPVATVRSSFHYWYLIAPSLCVFAAYSLTAAELRYLPAWLLMVWAALLAGLRLRSGSMSRIGQCVAILMAALIVASMVNGLYAQSRSVRHDEASENYFIAEGLPGLGIVRGDKVGAIGFDNDAHWAYLDDLRIVAEIRTGNVCRFWNESPAEKSDVLQKFSRAGAKAIIINGDRNFRSTSREAHFDFASCSGPDSSWHRIGDTEDYVYLLHDH
jgi:hypothetical protein